MAANATGKQRMIQDVGEATNESFFFSFPNAVKNMYIYHKEKVLLSQINMAILCNSDAAPSL